MYIELSENSKTVNDPLVRDYLKMRSNTSRIYSLAGIELQRLKL